MRKFVGLLYVVVGVFGVLVLTSCSTSRDEGFESPTAQFAVHRFNDSDLKLLAHLRNAFTKRKISKRHSEDIQEAFTKGTFPKKFWGVSISVYNPKHKMFRTIITKGTSPDELFNKVVVRTLSHLKKKKLKFNRHSKIQLDFIIDKPVPMPFKNFVEASGDQGVVEFGIDGFTVKDKDKTRFFLPGDAYTQSIHSLGQFEDVIKRKLGVTPTASTRDFSFERFKTKSYIGYRKRWKELYRGIPRFGDISKAKIKKAVDSAVNHILKYQKSDGRFLYYYDTTSDSSNDHEHPQRDAKKDPYYNLLRHIGGGLTLLDYFEAFQDDKVINPVERSIEYLVKQIRDYKTPEGKNAAYVFYNRKSKLGGAGLALLLLSRYKLITKNNTYDEYATKIANHLLNQIQESGEFFYYSVYLDEPILSPEKNKKLFNFYYPGEAISGLAMYLKTLSDKNEIARVEDKTKLALKFLIEKRPDVYKSQYLSLPADSWLMMGILSLWDFKEMRDPSYATFVFNDADQMVNHMYTIKNAPYPDYAGSYYYTYNMSYYPDGARAEGLTAALKLAEKIGDTKRAEKYKKALHLTAWSTYHLVNTPDAMYFAKNPKKAIGGIRFKPTRQWFRIDTIQHVISFYMKYFYID